MLVKCLYCDIENDALATAGFCDNCGKKLPSSAMVRTRKAILADATGSEAPTQSPRSPTSSALLTTAIVQLVAGGVFLVVGPALLSQVPETFMPLVLLFTIVPVALLAGMSWWAQQRPGPEVLLTAAGYAVCVAAGWAIHPGVARAWVLVQLIVVGLLAWVVWVSRGTTVRS